MTDGTAKGNGVPQTHHMFIDSIYFPTLSLILEHKLKALFVFLTASMSPCLNPYAQVFSKLTKVLYSLVNNKCRFSFKYNINWKS